MGKNLTARKSLLPLLMVLATPQPSAFSHSNAFSLPQVLETQIGVSEQPSGSNWGPKVSEYLAAAGISFPAPWCAAFIEWGMQKIGKKGAGAYVPSWNVAAKVVKHPRRGDLGLIYFPSLKRYAHIYCVSETISSSSVRTIEGNSNRAGSREGTEVVKKIRPKTARYVRWD
jgi:hypothetical protein